MFIKDHLDLADPLAFRKAPVILLELLGPDSVLDPGGLGPFLIHANAGELWIRIGAPWHERIIDFSGEMNNGIADHNASLIAGRMGEQVSPCNVPGTIDVFLGCS